MSSCHDSVDSIHQIDLLSVTVSDICWQHGTFRSYSNGTGRDKKYWYRSGAQTKIGDIKETVWYEIVEYVAKRDSEQWIVDALVEWKRDHNFQNLKPADLRKEALKAYSHNLFNNPRWVDFVPFNRKYRPKALETAQIVTVITDCCALPSQTTQEQIDNAYQNQLCCPRCGRWSEFKVSK